MGGGEGQTWSLCCDSTGLGSRCILVLVAIGIGADLYICIGANCGSHLGPLSFFPPSHRVSGVLIELLSPL